MQHLLLLQLVKILDMKKFYHYYNTAITFWPTHCHYQHVMIGFIIFLHDYNARFYKGPT